MLNAKSILLNTMHYALSITILLIPDLQYSKTEPFKLNTTAFPTV